MTDEIKDGGAAFPQLELVAGERDGHGDAIEAFTVATGGMTLRDWFAGQALAGLVSHTDNGMSQWCGSEHVATEYAYRFADAMLAAREAR